MMFENHVAFLFFPQKPSWKPVTRKLFFSALFISNVQILALPVSFVLFLLPDLPFARDEAFYSLAASFHSDSFGRNYNR